MNYFFIVFGFIQQHCTSAAFFILSGIGCLSFEHSLWAATALFHCRYNVNEHNLHF